MSILFQISWRNIWRHPARSGILMGAIIVGTWGGILVAGWGNGLIEQRVDYLISTELSHGQVHHPEYRAEREPWMTIPDAESILAYLEGDERVQSVSPRTLSEGMARSPVTTSGVRIHGVHPEKERATTALYDRLEKGDWLGDEFRNPVLIGGQLADKLRLEIGNRLVLQFQDIDNEITAGAFHISGIFRSASSDYDERNVFVKSDDLSALIAGETFYHEIAMSLTSSDQADGVIADVNERFPDVHAQTWHELSPEIRYIAAYSGTLTYFLMAIIMMALAFGILNTMLMAIFERMRELGMLLSIGMNRIRVFAMIMLESLMLTFSGALAGILLSVLTLWYLGDRGIDMGMFADGLAEFGFDTITYPFVTAGEFFGIVIIVIFAALIAAVYPAIKAFRLNPVEASKE